MKKLSREQMVEYGAKLLSDAWQGFLDEVVSGKDPDLTAAVDAAIASSGVERDAQFFGLGMAWQLRTMNRLKKPDIILPN